jgi:hypothetical protein
MRLINYTVALTITFFGGLFQGAIIFKVWGDKHPIQYIFTYVVAIYVVLMILTVVAKLETRRSKMPGEQALWRFGLIVLPASFLGVLLAIYQLSLRAYYVEGNI